jgi:hypothetical protein
MFLYISAAVRFRNHGAGEYNRLLEIRVRNWSGGGKIPGLAANPHGLPF